MFRVVLVVICSVLLGYFAFETKGYFVNNSGDDEMITIGYPKYWGPLVPALQCTAYGDSILSNQFEPLVVIGTDQLPHPLSAKSWSVSEDMKTYTFIIDTEKKFSNGTRLASSHVKASWEHGLKLEAESHNKSTLEVLKYIEGYESFGTEGEISGIQVPDSSTLIIKFKKPYRLAMDNFAGARMAPFLIDNNEYLGTGRFVITEDKDKKELLLMKNEYHPDHSILSNLTVKVVDSNMAIEKLKNGSLDAYEFAHMGGLTKFCLNENSNIACTSGVEVLHMGIELNQLQGRVFQNINHRKAFFTIVANEVLNNKAFDKELKQEINIDLQVYLKLQKGRVSNDYIKSAISSGQKFVEDFVKATKKQPLKINSSRDIDWLLEIIERHGVDLHPDSGKVTWEKLLEMQYKTSDLDVSVGGFSVVNGDPGGLYHFLGKNGAILAPMTYNERVGELLEEGKSIIDHTKLDEHYKKVNRAILEEVPIIHLGFVNGMSVYRNDRVKNIMDVKNREENRLHFYRKL